MSRTEIVLRAVLIIQTARRGQHLIILEDLEWLKEQLTNVPALKSELVIFHLKPGGQETVNERAKNFGSAIAMMMACQEAQGPSQDLEAEIDGYIEKAKQRREHSRTVCGN